MSLIPDSRPVVLNCYPPHCKQLELLSLLSDERPGIVMGHGISGRGGGKTRAGIMVMLESCLRVNPGTAHLWTAPTFGVGLQDTFLPTWREMVPQELWTFKASELRIYLFNGSYIDLRSRYVDKPSREPARGPNYAGAVLDEIREDPTRSAFDAIKDSVRAREAPRRWMLCITTPLPTWYQDQVFEAQAKGDLVVHWTSYDNPYLETALVDDFARDKTDDMRRQEIMGEWVSRSGVIWSEFEDAPWPEGNRHPHRWTAAMPYKLACDIGNRSAWLIIQQVQPTDSSGRELANTAPLDVVVAEYQPDTGDTQHMLREIKRAYGVPSVVCVGSDVAHKATTDGNPHTLFFRQHFGGVPVRTPGGNNVFKHRQLEHAKQLIRNANGDRRLCVSTHLVSHNAEKNRGILRMFRHDLWPTDGRELLTKDKGTNPQSVEDTRDALLYFGVCAHPPRVKMLEMRQ